MRSSQCAAGLFEFRILGLGGDEDGDVWVSIFPQSEEILIGRLGFDGVALHWRRRGQGRGGRVRLSRNSTTARDGREFSGTRQRRLALVARLDKPLRGRTRDTDTNS